MKKRIGIWLRVSTEMQTVGDSLEHHEHRARSYCNIKEWEVVEVYRLEAVSGKSVINHPEAQRMLADIKNGHINGIVFSKIARLARNVRELLEIADIFKSKKADLIALDDRIDTSNPAGMLFFTLLGAFSQWEREEISQRVKASVKTRASLGKSLGGEAPFGYMWVDKVLAINEKEALIRQKMYDLFISHRKKRTVARELNELGHTTRRGGKFSDTTVDRLLRDPIVIGKRRINYTKSLGDKKHWELKPESEWETIESPRLISDQVYYECQSILDEMSSKRTKTRRKSVHPFSGIATCYCGSKMYMRSTSPRYVCTNCNHKVLPEVLEECFTTNLKKLVYEDANLENEIRQLMQSTDDLDKEIAELQTKKAEIKKRLDALISLHMEEQIPKDAFDEHYSPLHQEKKDIERIMAQKQGEKDALAIQHFDMESTISQVRDVYQQWGLFTQEEKRSAIELMTKSIVVNESSVEIHLVKLFSQITHNEPSSVASPLAPSEVLQLCNTSMSLWLFQSSHQRMSDVSLRC